MTYVEVQFSAMYTRTVRLGFSSLYIFTGSAGFITVLISNHVQTCDIQEFLFFSLGGLLLLGGTFYLEDKGVSEELLLLLIYFQLFLELVIQSFNYFEEVFL